jgi:hypothetical protein
MLSFQKTGWRLGALALVAALAVACGSSTVTFPPPTSGASPTAIKVIVPGGSGSATEAPATEGPRATSVTTTVDNITADYTYKESLITPLAHLYGTFLDDFVIVTVDNANKTPVKVVVKSVIDGYTSTATDTVTVAAGASEEIRQNPRLTPTAIDGLNSEHQADLNVTVSYLDNGQPRTILDQTSQTLVTSRRDFPWGISGFTQQDNFNLVVAMVTPTDTSVEGLIRRAANYDPSGAMTSGYDSEQDANGTVYQRLADIWAAETNDFKLTYISTPITFASNSSQRIRLPGEVLDTNSGNCIELTLLYASVAEALGMQSAIIIIPGHAYVAIREDNKNDYYYFIETTMIGSATFTDAVKTGLSEWNDAATHVNDGDADYGWVSIESARADGITPIPWR